MGFTLATPFNVTRRRHQRHLALAFLLLLLVVAGRDAVPENLVEVRLNITRVGLVLVVLGTGRWFGPGLVFLVIFLIFFGNIRIPIRLNVLKIDDPLDAARVVVHTTRAAVDADDPVIESVEPALKPYQPIHRINVPSAWRTDEWPGSGSGLSGRQQPHEAAHEAPSYGLPSSAAVMKRPGRGPMTAAPQRAAMPPVRCTTPEPAKSITPPSKAFGFVTERKPAPLHAQWTTTG